MPGNELVRCRHINSVTYAFYKFKAKFGARVDGCSFCKAVAQARLKSHSDSLEIWLQQNPPVIPRNRNLEGIESCLTYAFKMLESVTKSEISHTILCTHKLGLRSVQNRIDWCVARVNEVKALVEKTRRDFEAEELRLMDSSMIESYGKELERLRGHMYCAVEMFKHVDQRVKNTPAPVMVGNM